MQHVGRVQRAETECEVGVVMMVMMVYHGDVLCDYMDTIPARRLERKRPGKRRRKINKYAVYGVCNRFFRMVRCRVLSPV